MKNEQPRCPHCGQHTEYPLAIDRGSIHIVKRISHFIEAKGINIVHPRKEMEGSYLTSNEVGNLTRPRIHGLIAKVSGNPGNYCLTQKGLDFLNGKPIPKIARVFKGRNIGYLNDEFVTIKEFNTGNDYWNGIGYEIRQGNVVTRKEPENISLF